MTNLTKEQIGKQKTFECLLLSRVSKYKNFSLDFFNQFISKNENGIYQNSELQDEFEAWLARAELDKGE